MVWYNPFSWGKDENAAAAAPMATTPVAPPAASEYPAPAYGGRKRKHRKTHRGGKKHRSKTGRRKQH